MPIIRHVQINHGKISNGQQNDILATSVDYGNYFNNSVVITAQSSQGGYGLLHITRIGKEADSCLNNWLKNLQKNLGKHIIFHIIKPNQDHSEHYQDNLQRACLKHNIDPIIYFFNPTSYFFKTKKQNQTIMINSDGITSKDSEDCEAFENISNPSSTSKSNLATKTYIHPKEAVLTSTSLSQQSQKEFISTIGLILQNAISDLETTIIKNNKNNTLIDEVARETKVVAELKELQTLLPRLTIYPKQPITKEFIEFAQSIINQYYQQTETNCFNLSTKNYYTETHKSQEKIVLNDMLEKLRQAFINAGATANLSTPESLLINGPNGNLGATAFQLSDSWFIIKQKQRLPTETSCQGFINAVNKQIQDTLDKIFHSTASKIVDGEYLAKLQKNLEQLVNEPNQLLTKEFVELINSTINQYDENKEKLTATPEVKHLLSMLKREFSSLLSRDLWPDSEIYGPNVTVDRHGEILVDENYELTTSTIAEPEVYKDAKNQQQLIDAIKLKLSANISQLKKLSTSIFTLPLLSCENNKLKELNALQHDLDELIEDPKQPLTQPFIQQIRRKILLYLFTPSAKKTDINTLEALQQGLNQFVEHPEQPLPAAFIKLIKKQAYLSLLSSFAKKNEREELAILQQGLNQLVEQPGQPLTQTFLKLIKKQIYQSSLTSFTKESERAVLEALQQILEQCIEHPEQSIKVPFIQLLRKKVTLHLFAPPSAPPELSDKEKKNMDIEVINKNKKERIEIKK
ncbi:hypothetical protein A0O36_02591 [Piscirickettsiaceae bacterium NZ-RLO1]|nr:hypothetical protein A0O36_02591 [Piscirickettsiaceae bacterium NZ-RLO1]